MQSEESFSKKYFTKCLTFSLYSLVLGIPVLFWYALFDAPIFAAIILFIFLFVVAYATYDEIKDQIMAKMNKLSGDIVELEKKKAAIETSEKIWKASLKERASGFPSLFQQMEKYEKLQDESLSNHLKYKPHPAISSAEIVKNEAKRRREAEFLYRKTQALIEYYENIAPFLLDFKEQEFDDNEEALKEYTEEEQEDPVTNYLTKEEYRKLTPIQRNQIALERYWKRPKSKWLIGRIYERYIGYIYESKNYEVEYVGIVRGLEDLGRDLICKKGKEIIVIQCKNWSQFKTIFEKHIFQFFGTVFQYKDEYKNKDVEAIFYTTTELSDLARRFARELGIELKEKFKMDQGYPCIKCNISSNGQKIYHLPFDQQYDNTKIEVHKGEFYTASVEEAERKGFRRAYRWRGAAA